MGNARLYAEGYDALGREVKFYTTKGKTMSEIRVNDSVMIRTQRFNTAVETFNGMICR